MKHYLLLLISLLILGSCEKTEHISQAPSLEVYVTDPLGNALESANVFLFENRDDWDEKVNVIDSLITDIHGYVYFQELEELQYFLFATKDSLTNTYGTIGLLDSLKKDEIRLINIKITHLK